MDIIVYYFRRYKQYRYYIWIYVAGAVLTFANSMWIQSKFLFYPCLVVLYGILFYKGIAIFMHYKNARLRNYCSIDKKEFSDKYRWFRIKVALFWLAFIILCLVGRLVFEIDYQYFYSCTYFFLALDRWFVNEGCLLRKFSDFKNKTVKCCCGCPCRGWDLSMIHTPLLFAISAQSIAEDVLICVSSILAVISLINWERAKYRLVEVRAKCPKVCNLSLCRENR